MAAIDYEAQGTGLTLGESVELNHAVSGWLRELDGSVFARNKLGVGNIPATVPLEVDEIFAFVEACPFDELRSSVERYLRKESMRAGIGRIAFERKHDRCAVSTRYSVSEPDVLVRYAAGRLWYEWYGVVESSHFEGLGGLEIPLRMPEDEADQRPVVLHFVGLAINDSLNGVPLRESKGAEALGWRRSPVYS